MLPDLTSPRLQLQVVSPADLDSLWTLWIDPDVRQYLFDDVAIPQERAAEILVDSVALAADGLGLWPMRLLGSSSLIGCVGLFPVSTVVEYEPRLAGAVEPLVALAPSVWHRGLATEALATVINYAFEDRGMSQLAAVVDVPNTASHRLVTRLGFEQLSECAGPRYRMRTYTLSPAAFASATNVAREA